MVRTYGVRFASETWPAGRTALGRKVYTQSHVSHELGSRGYVTPASSVRDHVDLVLPIDK